ncbi:transposase family protein [Actinophytocola sp.]|uniref:transposase family protein n=1 Tax=Actinophytocola sp. TaxID=1872138 RepID=UPI003D6A34DD
MGAGAILVGHVVVEAHDRESVVPSSLIPVAFIRLVSCVPQAVVGLCRFLAVVPGPCRRRGVRYRLVTVLALAVAAVAAGVRLLTAIGEWAADLPQRALGALGALGARCDGWFGRYQPSTEVTVRRVLQCVDGDHLDAVLGAWTRDTNGRDTNGRDISRAAVAVDGTTLRARYGRRWGPPARRPALARRSRTPHPWHRSRTSRTPHHPGATRPPREPASPMPHKHSVSSATPPAP